MKAFFTSLFLLGGLSVGTIAAQQPRQAQSRARCLQKCFDEYLDDLGDCQDMCFVCDLWIVVCIAGHTNLECVDQCAENAEDDYNDCKADCPPLQVLPAG